MKKTKSKVKKPQIKFTLPEGKGESNKNVHVLGLGHCALGTINLGSAGMLNIANLLKPKKLGAKVTRKDSYKDSSMIAFVSTKAVDNLIRVLQDLKKDMLPDDK